MLPISIASASVYADDVFVKGYHRSDGTYVPSHMRSAPDGNVSNNWSTRGNINPYTGEMGTISHGLYSVPEPVILARPFYDQGENFYSIFFEDYPGNMLSLACARNAEGQKYISFSMFIAWAGTYRLKSDKSFELIEKITLQFFNNFDVMVGEVDIREFEGMTTPSPPTGGIVFFSDSLQSNSNPRYTKTFHEILMKSRRVFIPEYDMTLFYGAIDGYVDEVMEPNCKNI